MRRVRINVGKVGVVSKNGDYIQTLKAGTYWLGFNQKVNLYEMDKIYTSELNLNIMLKDKMFSDCVEIIEVQDNEIALKYTSQNFDGTFGPGKYFYFKGLMNYHFKMVDLSELEVNDEIDKSILNRIGLEKYIRKFKVESFEEALLFVDGKFKEKLNKGTYNFWKNNTTIEVLKVDLRQLQMEVSGQEILTKDKAGIRVNFYLQYNVVDSKKALLNSKDFEKQLYVLVQMALREYVGTLTLDELLSKKESVAEYVLESIKTKAGNLGVKSVNAGIKDIILPGEIKDIMNKVMIAEKKAQANTIARREETASARSMLNTAKLLEENEMLFKLKEMEYVEKIADKIGEISVTGSGNVINQLKEIFVSAKN